MSNQANFIPDDLKGPFKKWLTNNKGKTYQQYLKARKEARKSEKNSYYTITPTGVEFLSRKPKKEED